MDHHNHIPPPDDAFSQHAATLPDAAAPPALRMTDNAELPLHIDPVRNHIGDNTVHTAPAEVAP
jgi:hypothetical protein